MDLRSEILFLRRWAWLLVLAAVAGGALAYLVMQTQPRVYQASATVIVGPSLTAENPDYTGLLASQLLSQTYARVATTGPLLERVIQLESLSTTTEDLRRRVFAIAPRDSTLITITVQDSQPDRAARTANGVANEVVRVPAAIQGRQPGAQDFIDQEVAATQAEILDVRAAIQRLRALPSAAPTGASALQALDARLASLEAAYATLLAYSSNASANVLTVIEPAVPPDAPSSPRVFVNTALAAAASLLIALGLLFLREQLDDTVRSAAELQTDSGVQVVGVLPETKGRGGRVQRRLAIRDEPQSRAAEAARSMRANVEFTRKGAPLRRLLVTSWLPGDGKTTTAANLAVAFAEAGRRTILVDADLRQPGLDRIFELDNRAGLTTWLAGTDITPKDALGETSAEGLWVLTSGPLPPSPVQLLGSERMQVLLQHLDDMADLVIIDSPGMSGVTDAAILSTMADATLLVVRAGRTRRGAVRQAREGLSRVGGPILGVVVNRATDHSFSDAILEPTPDFSSSEPSPAQSPSDTGGAPADAGSRL